MKKILSLTLVLAACANVAPWSPLLEVVDGGRVADAMTNAEITALKNIAQGTWSSAIKPAPGRTFQILPLGDSITLGATGAEGAYRIPMWASAAAANIPIAFVGPLANGPGWDPTLGSTDRSTLGAHHHFGYSGDTCATLTLNTTYYRPAAEWRPDFAYYWVGENDIAEGASQGTKDAFSACVTAEINQILSDNPRLHLFIINLIPSTGDAAWQTARTIFKNLISACSAAVPDQTRVTLLDPDTTTYNSATNSSDGTHPNTAGYLIINNELLWPAILPYLNYQ